MIYIKYEEYFNDYSRREKEKTFQSLKALQDWLFDLNSDPKYGLWFIDPDKKTVDDLYNNGAISSRNRESGISYWVKYIANNDGIMFSTGRYTNGVKYWNEEIKQWLRDCNSRKENPASAYKFV